MMYRLQAANPTAYSALKMVECSAPTPMYTYPPTYYPPTTYYSSCDAPVPNIGRIRVPRMTTSGPDATVTESVLVTAAWNCASVGCGAYVTSVYGVPYHAVTGLDTRTLSDAPCGPAMMAGAP